MARPEVVEWLKNRLAPRYEAYVGEIVARRPYKNEIKKVLEKYTNLSKKRLETYQNGTENIIKINSLMQKVSGALGRVVDDILPGETGQVLYETAKEISAGTAVTLSDGRIGKLLKHAAPGETVDAEIETGESILAGVEIEVGNKIQAKVTSDIAPGQIGEIAWVQYGQAKCPAGCVLGVVEYDDDARVWQDFKIEGLADAFGAIIPSPPPTGQLDNATYAQLIEHVRTAGGSGLLASMQLWRDEGLI